MERAATLAPAGKSAAMAVFLVAALFLTAATSAANLQLHLDAASSGGNRGDSVVRWPDVSPGFFRDALAAAPASAPTLQTFDTPSGVKNVVRFDGANDFLSLGGFRPTRGDYTVLVVAAHLSPDESKG